MTADARQGRNPWPCERCGDPVEIAPDAGRLPWSAVVSVAGFVTLAVITALAWRSGALAHALLALAALALVAVLTLRLQASAAWRCPNCRLRAGPRLRHSGVALPVVVVPTYNNAGSIAEVIRRIGASVPDLPVIVVDDGSTDGTGGRAREALAALGAETAVVTHPRNLGKGAALVTGLRAALARGYSHALTLDGDGQHYPEDLPRLRQAVEAEPTAVIVGARDLSGDTVQTVSRFGRRFSNFWIKVQTGVTLADSQSGFRAYPVAPVLSLGGHGRAYDFEVEVLILAARAGLALRSVPIHVFYPPPSERVSHFDKLWDNVRISWVNTRLLAAAPFWALGWPARLSRIDPPLAKSRVWSGRSRGGAVGHLFFFAVLKLLGRRVAYLFLYPVALYFMFGARRAVRASGQFLDAAMGPAPSAWARFWRSYDHVLTFSRCILDRAITQVSGARGFTWDSEGAEALQLHGALMMSAHLGNYEVGSAFLHITGVPVNVVMLDAEARAIQAVHDRFGASHNNPKVIAINRGQFPSLAVLSALRRGELVALHGDRIVDERWVWCDFFGRPAPFPTGMFLIAAAARVPLVLTFGFKEGTSHYRFIAEPPRDIVVPRERREAALAEHARWYASRLEHYARRYPLQWFNFYDFWATPPIAGKLDESASAPQRVP